MFDTHFYIVNLKLCYNKFVKVRTFGRDKEKYIHIHIHRYLVCIHTCIYIHKVMCSHFELR